MKPFFCSILLLCSFILQAQTVKIGVLSDLHYMAPALLEEKGEAFDQAMHGDRKLLLESPAILKEAVDRLLDEKVGLVMIAGDLTKDGELLSHQGVAQALKPLVDAGIKVLVVPGNHDINNPFAQSFNGKTTRQVATVSAREFQELYGLFGFDSAISKDEASLSYVSEPVEGLRVFCLDDCMYDKNRFKSKGDAVDASEGGGWIKPETMVWMLREISVAKNLGKQVVALMHHNLVEHFDGESAFPGYMTTQSKEVQKKCMAAGLNTIFTGHFHANDVAMAEDGLGHTLFDVETGSIVTYPCPYRLIQLDGDSLTIETKLIEKIEGDLPEGILFQDFARDEAVRRMSDILSDLLDQHYDKISTSIPASAAVFIDIPEKKVLLAMLSKHLLSSATEVILAHYHGNEPLLDDAQGKRDLLLSNMDAFVHELARESSGLLAPVTEKTIAGSNAFKHLKGVFISIWNDRSEPGYITQDDSWQSREAVNDLDLMIQLPKRLVLSKE